MINWTEGGIVCQVKAFDREGKMAGEADLRVLLRSMEPMLFDAPYGFIVGAVPGAFAIISEEEGPTVVAEASVLRAAGLPVADEWARISLTVHSDLAAVGLTAAFARALAEVGISANVIAGFHHDHIFVPWAKRLAALEALQALSRNG